VDRLEIIEALKHVPEAVEAETAGLSNEMLRYRPADGEWSIKEVSGHLRDSAELWHKRLYAAWSLTDPLWPFFDGEESVRQHNYQDADLRTVIREMREWRLKMVDLLSHAVDWSRLGQHREMGRRSLKQWGEYLIGHDAEHLAGIRALKQQQTAARLPG
jgi:DinB superfamily